MDVWIDGSVDEWWIDGWMDGLTWLPQTKLNSYSNIRVQRMWGAGAQACSYSAARPAWHIIYSCVFPPTHAWSHASIDIIQKWKWSLAGSQGSNGAVVEVAEKKPPKQQAQATLFGCGVRSLATLPSGRRVELKGNDHATTESQVKVLLNLIKWQLKFWDLNADTLAYQFLISQPKLQPRRS